MKSLRLVALIFCLSLLTTPLQVTQAANHVIYVDSSATGINNGSSWEDAYFSLQDALSNATAGDEIWVANGVYYPDIGVGFTPNSPDETFTLLQDVDLYGGFAGGETSIDQRVPRKNITVLSGDVGRDDTTNDDIVETAADIVNANAYNVVTGAGVDATLSGFVITGGQATGGSSPQDQGGGIHISGGTVTLTDVAFYGNEGNFGGGLYVAGGSLSVTDATFGANLANSNGGGLLIAGGNPTMANVIIAGNEAGTHGGGLMSTLGVTTSITNVTIYGNESGDDGGGVYNAAASTLTMTNAIIHGNQASGFGNEIATDNAAVNISYSLVYGAEVDALNGGSWTDTGDGLIGNNNEAPEFVDADGIDNVSGTPDDDLRLAVTSPAIDTGSNDAVTVTTDIDDLPRVVDSDQNGTATVDMGAHEYFVGRVYVDADAIGTDTGTSWANAFIHLQDALSAVNPGSEIWVAEGIYYPDEGSEYTDDLPNHSFFLQQGVGLYGGFTGTETERSARDPLANLSILSGDIEQNDTNKTNGLIMDAANISGTNSYQVVEGVNVDDTTVLDGFVINAGKAGNTPNHIGGGMRLSNASPVIKQVTFLANEASYGGGFGMNAASSPTVEDIVIAHNTAERGGAIYGFEADLTLTNALITDNTTTSGGTVQLSRGTIQIVNTAVVNNTGGGGLDFFESTASLTNVTVAGNIADSLGGGLSTSGDTLTIRNSIFYGNTAGSNGDEIAQSTDNITITHTLLDYAKIYDIGTSPAWPQTGAGLITDDTDPLFTDLANGDVSLQPASPVINAGSNSADLDGMGAGTLTIADIPTDLVGTDRILFGTVDMGAYETAQALPTGDPTSLTATYNSTTNAIDLSWTDTAANEDAYVIERSTDDGTTWTVLDATLPPNTESASDTSVTCGTDYTYRVKAINTNGDSAYTNQASASTPACTPDGEASAFYFAAPHTVGLTWVDNATNETGYVIERKKDGAAAWYMLTTTPADTESYTDDTVTCDQDYVYRVTAAGSSAMVESNVVSTTCTIFVDVPSPNQPPFFEQWIEDFYQAGITTGCSGEGVDLEYCPETVVDRGQMAVFILRALAYPGEHTPTGIDPNPFMDVPSPNQPPFFEEWIEDFLNLGITQGCGTDSAGDLLFCPEVKVDRGQMAVFILRAIEGPDYTPEDDPTNPFVDVPGPNQPPAWEPWIEDFYNRGITTGCNGGIEGETLAFCPGVTVDRGQMAVFILRAFDTIENPDTP